MVHGGNGKGKKKTVSEEASDFSRKLSEYILASGRTVYKISQLSGLGRTAIQHAMSGRLVPTQEFVKTLITKGLNISAAQYEELMELHLRAKIGEKFLTGGRACILFQGKCYKHNSFGTRHVRCL